MVIPKLLMIPKAFVEKCISNFIFRKSKHTSFFLFRESTDIINTSNFECILTYNVLYLRTGPIELNLDNNNIFSAYN